MGKITRAASKLHDEAMAILNLSRSLSEEEQEKVFRQYNPMAEHNVGKGAIFFTPFDLAREFSLAAECTGTVIDLGAGIGALAKQMVWRNRWSNIHRRLVCVEISPVFVEIGKKLVPEAEWYCGDIFDVDFMQSLGEFDLAISNPPYGHIPSEKTRLVTKGPAQWRAIEVALRLAWGGAVFIIPEQDLDYSIREQKYRENSNREKYLDKNFPGVYVMPSSFDAGVYQDQWTGAAPNVQIASIEPDDVKWQRPYGFLDILPRLIDVPKVKAEKKAPLPKKPMESPSGTQLTL
jgi:predicted RNA methylase